MRILIVDDDSFDRQLIKREIGKQSGSTYVVDEAIDVSAASELIPKNNYDVVLLDYSMPARDGIELVIELKNNPRESSMAIVMMSASEDENLALRCLRAGAHDFLVKSEITSSRLHRAILHAQTRFELETELYKSYQIAKKLAESDSLTGLANRYVLEETLKHSLKQCDRYNQNVGLLLIDVDNFKYINDQYGHDVGDLLLKKVSNRIKGCLRGSELFARLGGDEFAILMPGLEDAKPTSRVAQRIQHIMEKPFELGSASIKSSVSIGIAMYPQTGDNIEDLFKHSDIALYRAKNTGRSRSCFFEEEMQQEFLKRFQLEVILRHAIQGDRFHLQYQPVIDVRTNQLTGFEALLRLKFDGKQHFPDEFIPIAEDCRLIIDIGRWVIFESIKTISDWQQRSHGELAISLNVSAVQLEDDLLVRYLEEAMDKYSVAPQQVVIELTETALIGDSVKKINAINSIHALGCKIALDDFGTGYSSISHLRHFPIDIIKIDKSLMPSPEEGGKALPLLKGLVAFAASMGIEVVAEGVESDEHYSLCQQFRVDRMQGYFFAKPLLMADVEEKYFKLH